MERIVIGNALLIHGDSLVEIPTITHGLVDAVITDPPYKIIGGGNRSGLMKGGIFDPSVYSNDGKIVGAVPKFTDWIPLLYNLNTNLEVMTMVNDKNLRQMLNAIYDAKFGLHNVLVWDKGIPTPNRWFMKHMEFVCYAWKGRARPINDMGSPQGKKIRPKIGGRLHPTEKPIELMEFYIGNVTAPDDTVLDPFMGSGSTGVAALKLGRKFIGIEKDKTHFDTAVREISNALS